MIFFSYIDPNAGFQIFSSLGPVFAAILAFLGILFWPVKQAVLFLARFFKKKPLLFIILTTVIAAMGITVFVYLKNSRVPTVTDAPKVIVLGLDGLDPKTTQRLMEEGELPNFSKLKDRGTFSELATVLPAQSPVAWSTFATGLNPGDHGIYDFLWRHPDTYQADLALTELKKGVEWHLFGKKLAFGPTRYAQKRKGVPVWMSTSEAGVPTLVHHCPLTFPPDAVRSAMLSGMGVPDLRGTQGTYTLYVDRISVDQMSNEKVTPVVIRDDKIKTFIKGPIGSRGRPIQTPLEMTIDRKNRSVAVRVSGKETVIGVGEWSPWIRISFKLNPFSSVEAMTRFFVRALEPDFELYAGALNFTPENPPHPISFPKGYARDLRGVIGDFHTLGMPHDTWALSDGAIDEDAFLSQSQTILEEETKMLKYELERFEGGLFISVIVTPDRIQHMFWRANDKDHPLYTQSFADKYGRVIDDMYRRMDELVGYVLSVMGDDAVFFVVSDHGFTSFRRAVHINSWLRDEGYLFFKNAESSANGKEAFEGVDWSKTKAYALGFGGVYLNLKGREESGMIEPGAEADRLKAEITEKLMRWEDTMTGQTIVNRVFDGKDVYDGRALADAPDLILGFKKGYRASWQTALGASPKERIEDNLNKWSGDHIVDPILVPGIFFSNKPIQKENPSLYDIAPTLLKLFGIPIPAEYRGSPLIETEPPA